MWKTFLEISIAYTGVYKDEIDIEFVRLGELFFDQINRIL